MARPNPFRLDPYESADSRLRERRVSRPIALEELLEPWLRERRLVEGKRGVVGQVYKAWDEVVGPALARRARPARFAAGELLVEVSSMVHLHELKNFTGEGYRHALNGRLGSERVKKLAFKLSS